MNSYIIKNVNRDGYDRFLLWLTFESLLDAIATIENSPTLRNKSGKILIDQLFITGDGDNRFISCEFKNGKLNMQTACIVRPTDFFRKETLNWLRANYDYVENSILTIAQRQKIKDGIAF